jgi:hypothetical protein
MVHLPHDLHIQRSAGNPVKIQNGNVNVVNSERSAPTTALGVVGALSRKPTPSSRRRPWRAGPGRRRHCVHHGVAQRRHEDQHLTTARPARSGPSDGHRRLAGLEPRPCDVPADQPRRLATKTKADAAVVFPDGTAHLTPLDGNYAVREAQKQAMRFNALAGAAAPTATENWERSRGQAAETPRNFWMPAS